uniref:Uncharacterized protein n=1 Tax=Arundo donax TaxID=35708 RepID=A0A0A9B172_ARUDO
MGTLTAMGIVAKTAADTTTRHHPARRRSRPRIQIRHSWPPTALLSLPLPSCPDQHDCSMQSCRDLEPPA